MKHLRLSLFILLLSIGVLNFLSCKKSENPTGGKSSQFGGHSSEFLSHHPIFDYPSIKKLGSQELYFYVEIPKGETKKFELRTTSGNLLMDRMLCPRRVRGTQRLIQSYPVHYGIVPGKFNVDQDPLDLLVIGSDEKYRKMLESGKPEVRKVRVIGLLKMEECSDVPCTPSQWEQDWKIIAVDLEDPDWKKADDLTDIPSAFRKEISEFFSNYKGSKVGKSGAAYPQVRVTGFLSKDKALAHIRQNFQWISPTERLKEIETCHERYKTIAQSKIHKTEMDQDYLWCLKRVHYEGFFPESSDFQFFLKFNAHQLLLSLKHPDADFEKSLEQMKERKTQGLTYYRFVEKDEPSPPGSGKSIYEWVKTFNRNEGCSEDFPPQHYESQPLFPGDSQ